MCENYFLGASQQIRRKLRRRTQLKEHGSEAQGTQMLLFSLTFTEAVISELLPFANT